ncbi:MAG TPA: hypothetical protein VGK00_15405 [Anaerolineales bacterium]|jgi:hypothetical protein
MKNSALRLAFSLSKIQKQHIQLFFLALTVLMLVLGAGAPVDGGGISR